LYLKSGAAFPANPFDGALIEVIDTGEKYVAIAGQYELIGG
jgi:hypothetical protein